MTSATTDSTGLADRYALALFELAEADKALDGVASELDQVKQMIRGNADLAQLIRSPVISREAQEKALDAVLRQAGSSGLLRRFVGVVARNRRLFALPSIIAAFQKRLADRRGEVVAEVRSAKALTPAQLRAITQTVKSAMGANVVLNTSVDPNLLGGLVVKIGSRMIDSSLRTKLHRLSLAIKGVG